MHWKDSLPDWYIKKYGKQPCVNIGTAGHVDHGKTTLIQALTGNWTSVHSQELKRGITIRVGYSDAAFYKCKDCESPLGYSTEPKCHNCGKESELSRVISFVDSPGHESLMANMLSGSALMDGALLLVAANSKVPQPQTKEHLLALQILGIKQIVIVQNKVDLISHQDALSNYSEITKFVKGTKAASSPIIPISAQSSLNMDALIGAIEETIETPVRDEASDTVMHVLRSFDINKPGTKIKNLKGGVIGGSITQGKLSVGDEIEIKPGIINPKKKSYQSIQTEIVSFGTLPENSTEAKLKISLFDTAVGSAGETKVVPVKVGELLRISVGTAPVPANVKKVKSDNIEVEFRRPVCLFDKGSVALSRRIAERWRLIGAGIVG